MVYVACRFEAVQDTFFINDWVTWVWSESEIPTEFLWRKCFLIRLHYCKCFQINDILSSKFLILECQSVDSTISLQNEAWYRIIKCLVLSTIKPCRLKYRILPNFSVLNAGIGRILIAFSPWEFVRHITSSGSGAYWCYIAHAFFLSCDNPVLFKVIAS